MTSGLFIYCLVGFVVFGWGCSLLARLDDENLLLLVFSLLWAIVALVWPILLLAVPTLGMREGRKWYAKYKENKEKENEESRLQHQEAYAKLAQLESNNFSYRGPLKDDFGVPLKEPRRPPPKR